MATVNKRTWTYNGKQKTAWVVRYTDQAGKGRLKTFQSKGEADRARKQIENEIDLGNHTPSGASLAIRDVAQGYLGHLESLKNAGSIGDGYYRNIEIALRLSIIPKLGAIQINELTAEQVNVFTRYMLEEQHLANKTVNARRDMLRRMEDWAGAMGYTKRRITAAAKQTFRLNNNTRIRIPTQDEVTAILRAAEAPAIHPRVYRGRMLTRLHIQLAVFCGLRFGEISGLTTDSLDFAGGRSRSGIT